MLAMFDELVRPKLVDLGFGGGVTVIRKIHVFGAGESVVEAKLLDCHRRGRVPEVGITASDAVISLRHPRPRGQRKRKRERRSHRSKRLIRERLGDMVFGADDEELNTSSCRLLVERKDDRHGRERDGGPRRRKLGRVPGASASLRGGVVAYVNEIKHGVLGVPEEMLQRARGGFRAGRRGDGGRRAQA